MNNTEQKILDAAMKVFAREGYEGATTREIAQEADVSEMTLFRKFQSKEQILSKVVIKNRDETLQTFESIALVEKDADLRTGLQSMGRYIMEALRDRLDLYFLLIEEGHRRPEIAEILASIPQMAITRLSEYFELQIKNGRMLSIDTRSAALTFISYPYYIILLKGVHIDDIQDISEKDFEAFIDIFIKGIEKR